MSSTTYSGYYDYIHVHDTLWTLYLRIRDMLWITLYTIDSPLRYKLGDRAMHLSYLNHDEIRDAPQGMMYGLGSSPQHFLT